MQPTTSWNDTQKILAFVLVVAFIIVIFVWMFHPPATDAAATAVLNTLVGTLGGYTGMVVTFYFGSSRSSTSKDQTIANLSTGTTTTPTNGHTAAAAVVPPAPAPA